jgi:hypothetical protein
MDEENALSVEAEQASGEAERISRRSFILRGSAATAGLGAAAFLGSLFGDKDKPVSQRQTLPDAKYGKSLYGRGVDSDKHFGQESPSSDGR